MFVSDDGRHFRAAPPVIETGLWGERIEVGAVEKIGDRYYMLLGVGKSHALGSRHLSELLAGRVRDVRSLVRVADRAVPA